MPLLQIFAKPPIEGKVKTRLIPDIGANGATRVYRYCLAFTLDLARSSTLHYEVWLSEAAETPLFDGLECRIQQGNDLGKRMYLALNHHLQAYPNEPVLLIGSDCLDLTVHHLNQAIECLSTHDLVLLPSFDGGFAMIGCRVINQSLFDHVLWSSPLVLQQTLANAGKLGYRTHLLETVRDIDTLDDLNHYPALRGLIENH
ncbi:MAG: TIGR04282 family arsenosugar biosynthesis glycosyltransferase [Gammaproteobacteria bacterium]|nr:TIGR04282 family arsenosugar biosynthesis glycosyltransferase [Gammaproteobacteria bacterium]